MIGSDNDLSPGRRHGIICNNTEILLFGPLKTNSSDIQENVFQSVVCETVALFLGLSVLKHECFIGILRFS